MLAAPPHRSEPSAARSAHPPLSGGGGGGDGDDFSALAANVARGLDPPPEEAASRPWVWPLLGGPLRSVAFGQCLFLRDPA
jgi:hypothetical protein